MNLISRLYNTKFIQNCLAVRRKKRVEFILSKVKVFDNMSILDVGCGIDGRSFENFIPDNYNIIGIDIRPKNKVTIKHPGFKYLQINATDLNIFKDKQFDLCVSIGMIEHVCNPNTLEIIAHEIDRVSKQYVVIVPWKYSWIEPHYKIPFFALLPYSLKLLLIRVFNLNNQREFVKSNPNYLRNNTQWLSNKQYKKIFPGSKCYLTNTLETVAIIKKE